MPRNYYFRKLDLKYSKNKKLGCFRKLSNNIVYILLLLKIKNGIKTFRNTKT